MKYSLLSRASACSLWILVVAATGTPVAAADQEQAKPQGLLDTLGKLFQAPAQPATPEAPKPAVPAQDRTGFDLKASAIDLVPGMVVEFVLTRPPEGGECAVEFNYGDGSAKSFRLAAKQETVRETHSFEKTGSYDVVARGAMQFEGFSTTFACPGENRVVTVQVRGRLAAAPPATEAPVTAAPQPQPTAAADPREIAESFLQGKAAYDKDDYKGALPKFLKVAELGHAKAQGYLGWMYETGHGVPANREEALKWYRKSAAQGEAESQDRLGNMYENGLGVAKDEAEAVRWYRKSAEQGYPPAQAQLGAMYATGRGLAKDLEEAVKWLRWSAGQENALGQNYLGYLYQMGLGVEKDEVAAVRWYRRSAEHGAARGQTSLGVMYEKGLGVTADRQEAVKWYRLAAKQGFTAASEHLKRLGEQ